MKKEICLNLDKDELKIIDDLMNFQVMYGMDDPYHERFGRDNYLMMDGTIMTHDEIIEKLNILPSFNKKYQIDKDIILEIEVGSNTDFIFGYINNSLYTTDGELLIHNTSKYELEDLFRGFCFSTVEGVYNDNEIFKITELGKEILSQRTYVVKFKIMKKEECC